MANNTICAQSYCCVPPVVPVVVHAPGKSQCEGASIHDHAVSGVDIKCSPGKGVIATINMYNSSLMPLSSNNVGRSGTLHPCLAPDSITFFSSVIKGILPF